MFEPIFFIFLLDDLFKVYLNQILKYLKYFLFSIYFDYKFF